MQDVLAILFHQQSLMVNFDTFRINSKLFRPAEHCDWNVFYPAVGELRFLSYIYCNVHIMQSLFYPAKTTTSSPACFSTRFSELSHTCNSALILIVS